MCSQNASFRQKHANKWCLGLKPPTYSQIPPLLRDLPALMLQTFIWPSILLGELQHAEEATVYHAGYSCQLLGDLALLPPSPFFCIQGRNKIESYSLGLLLYTTSSGSKFKRKWEELKTSRFTLKPAEQQMYSPKWHILMTSILQIQDLHKVGVLAY